MSEFSDKLRLKEKAEEDIYFAKRSEELIRALHETDSAEPPGKDAEVEAESSAESEKKPASPPKARWHGLRTIGEWWSKLTGKIWKQR